MAQKLIDSGFKKVFALRGGWKEWSESGYPVEKKETGAWEATGGTPHEKPPKGDIRPEA